MFAPMVRISVFVRLIVAFVSSPSFRGKKKFTRLRSDMSFCICMSFSSEPGCLWHQTHNPPLQLRAEHSLRWRYGGWGWCVHLQSECFVSNPQCSFCFPEVPLLMWSLSTHLELMCTYPHWHIQSWWNGIVKGLYLVCDILLLKIKTSPSSTALQWSSVVVGDDLQWRAVFQRRHRFHHPVVEHPQL